MTAQEKFWFTTSIQVTEYKSGCAIPLDKEFFRARRKVMRGLEEHLVILDRPDRMIPETHDFINEDYFYKVTNVNGSSIYVKFEGEWVIFGSGYIY